MITGYDLVNSYYEDEKLYSTGDSELDDLLERAFCEGYEYAQREYSLDEEIKEALRNDDQEALERLRKKAKRKSAGIGAGIGAGAGAARILQTRKTTKPVLDKAEKDLGKSGRRIVAGLGYGGVAGITSGIGAGIGAAVGKGKFNRALEKAKRELEEEKKENKKK
jgi:hypothetical protein